jgi:hypothetical protein
MKGGKLFASLQSRFVGRFSGVEEREHSVSKSVLVKLFFSEILNRLFFKRSSQLFP